jgi:hypothetical protein
VEKLRNGPQGRIEMTFKRYTCWNSENVRNIIETEALQTSDHVFLATHHPMKIYREDLGGTPTIYDEEGFISEFLSDPRGTFVTVIGQVGTGKSHVIRRLSVNIKSTNSRRVILIPKIGTNLRDVLKLILEGLEGEVFDRYRETLDKATGALTVGEARTRILDELAIAVGPDRYPDTSDLDDYQAELVSELPNLLHDPVYRRLIDTEGAIIHILAEHILGQANEAERREAPRLFAESDLPHQVVDITSLAGPVRNLVTSFGLDSSFLAKAIEWINNNLDEAITRVLNLKGEDLNQLFLDVREVLAEEGKELVILIEDFARLQGIDMQLIEVLLVRPVQAGRNPLCPIRTALACTTGYYTTKLPDTVQARIPFRINMDLSVRDEQNKQDIAQFASRYLNAIRMDDGKIREWFNAEVTDPENNDVNLNSCLDCMHREGCHRGFGHRDGYGLFPFNEVALERMLGRIEDGHVKYPRSLLNGVLRPVLEMFRNSIEAGQFPPPEILNRFGPSSMTAILQAELQERDPERTPRRRALLELWTEGDSVIDLDTAVHEAFDLPPLGIEVQPEEREEGASEEDPTSEEEQEGIEPAIQELPAEVVQRIEALNKWSNEGQELQQKFVNFLRRLIFDAISDYINWDAQMLLPGFYRGSGGKPFRRESIHFTDSPRGRLAPILLKIPLNKNSLDEVLALQGLVLFEHFKTWSFPTNTENSYYQGSRYFRIFARQLHLWSDHILDQIRRTVREGREVYDPVPASVELLAIGTRMAGNPQISKNSIEDYEDALFMDYSDIDMSGKSETWKNLFRAFQREQSELKSLLLSRIPCTKGGSAQVQMVDAVQLAKPLKKIRRNWKPSTDLPELKQEYSVVSRLRERVDELLYISIQDEKQARIQRYDHLLEHLGGNIDKREIIPKIREVMEKTHQAASWAGIGRDKLEEEVENFNLCHLDEALGTLHRLRVEEKRERLFPELSRRYGATLDTADSFIESANRFLDGSIRKTESDIEDLMQRGGEDAEETITEIQRDFDALKDLLSNLQDG